MKKLIGLVLLLVATTASFAQQTYTPSEGNLKARQEFADSKFGIFLHWGLYSTFAQGEWYLSKGKLSHSLSSSGPAIVCTARSTPLYPIFSSFVVLTMASTRIFVMSCLIICSGMYCTSLPYLNINILYHNFHPFSMYFYEQPLVFLFVFVCEKETNKIIPKPLYKTSILVYNIIVQF